MSDGGEAASPPATALDEIVGLPQTDAVAKLRQGGWWTVAVGNLLAEWALARADTDAAMAANATSLATLVASEHGLPLELMAMIAYADARCAVHLGDLAAAESALLRAQESWRTIDAQIPYARSFLGLTQVLTMQGRYAEAGAAAQGAIRVLQPLVDGDPGVRMLLARAHRNRANLFVYQEQHAAARDAYLLAAAELERVRESLPPDEQGELEAELGHLALNLASAHTFLDAPDEAERLLQEAISRFESIQDGTNRGRSRTNLGRLYLRLGEYAAALAAFDQATVDLIGDAPLHGGEGEIDALRQADELLLEHALAYLSLNLLPEAALALERCERLFRATGQPYELAQARYAQGVLQLRQGGFAEAQAALDESLLLFTQLDNRFWRNRTQTALARLAQMQGDSSGAAVMVDALLVEPEMRTATGAVAWDLLGLVDLWLMRLHLWLERGELAEAERAAEQVATLLGFTVQNARDGEVALPHLVLRLQHARGNIAAARGDNALARTYFNASLELLDRQRASLPLEEVRTAYLDDKMAIYSDLVVSLLASPLPSDNEVADAFAVVERARSRALLERLLASVDAPSGDESAEVSAQRAALRRQLHWLYNQLLGESGNRHLDGTLSREVAQHEAAIQRLEWRDAPLLAQAEPVRLDELQCVLAPDQQALVYYFAGDEVLAFVVGRESAAVVRRVTTVSAVTQAQAELRFQLGRAEVGSEYVARHYNRLIRGVQDALGSLYQLLVAPLQSHLNAERVLVVPFGVLHLIPFHALWDGHGYWLEAVEIAYVPSASVAVHKRRESSSTPLRRFAGFAPYDERIPQSQAEIDIAATYFERAQRYHDASATVGNLIGAAAQSDVLHLATHGLFRPDNSFFSALKLADGWMDVRQIYRLNLAARLVVLSACESGVGEVRAGDEVVGLARGFLAAGSQYLVATLWNVHDGSAADLMGVFYRSLQGTPHGDLGAIRPSVALRAAQQEALARGEHPYYWASFFAIG